VILEIRRLMNVRLREEEKIRLACDVCHDKVLSKSTARDMHEKNGTDLLEAAECCAAILMDCEQAGGDTQKFMAKMCIAKCLDLMHEVGNESDPVRKKCLDRLNEKIAELIFDKHQFMTNVALRFIDLRDRKRNPAVEKKNSSTATAPSRKTS
jgi:hypothetical protein